MILNSNDKDFKAKIKNLLVQKTQWPIKIDIFVLKTLSWA